MAILDVGELPTGDNVVIKTSSYFNRTVEDILLPSPAEVRARALEKGFVYPGNPPPIRFPELGLIVKSGTNLTIAEAQCLWAIWKHLKCEVPVPELYGWVRDGEELFIYMKLIEGETLEARWDTLSVLERLDVSSELKTMTTALRGLRQGGKDAFIGTHFVGSQSRTNTECNRQYQPWSVTGYPFRRKTRVWPFHNHQGIS